MYYVYEISCNGASVAVAAVDLKLAAAAVEAWFEEEENPGKDECSVSEPRLIDDLKSLAGTEAIFDADLNLVEFTGTPAEERYDFEELPTLDEWDIEQMMDADERLMGYAIG